jgi:Gpi18-like mannosyltransferase
VSPVKSPVTEPRVLSGSPWPSAVVGWVAARLLVAISALVAHGLGSLPGQPRWPNVLFMWDGSFYRVLADHGYSGSALEAARFYPLYPLLGRWLDAILPGGSELALGLISNAFALVAAVALWKVVRATMDDEGLASRSVIMFSLFPASAVLVLGYAESLMVAFVLLAAWALVARRPAIAIAPLALAGLTRPTGVLAALPVAILFVTWWVDERRDPASRTRPSTFAAWVLAMLAPVAGAVTYLGWLQSTQGRGTAPIRLQSRLRGGFHEPLSRLAKMVYDVGTLHFRDVYNLGLVVVLIVAVIGAIRSRFSLAWTTYLIVGLLIALSANVVDSIGRYGVALAPAWAVGFAYWTRPRWLAWSTVGVFSVGMVILMTVWIRGTVIP